MSLTDIGIVAIDVVFAVAVLAAVSCLAYLVYLTIREHAELKSTAARAGKVAVADLARRSRSRAVRSLRPSAVHQRVRRRPRERLARDTCTASRPSCGSDAAARPRARRRSSRSGTLHAIFTAPGRCSRGHYGGPGSLPADPVVVEAGAQR